MTTTTEASAPPYVGPRPYSREESERFFGRASEVRALRAALYASRVVVLHGPSGAGKTSLVHAGLLEELEGEGEFDVLPVARVGGVPFEISVGSPFAGNVIASWETIDVDRSTSMASALQARTRLMTEDGLPAIRLAIIDQFEELFTWYPEHWKMRRAFLAELREALESDAQLRVLLVIRSDYLGQLDPLLGEFGHLSRTNLRLDLLRRAAAMEAVEGPLAATGVSFGEGVAGQLVDELLQNMVQRGPEVVEVQGEFVEPVQLQVVCDALWRNLPPGITTISTEHWKAFGNVDQAVSDFYMDSIYRTAAANHLTAEEIHEWVAANLVTEAGTRATVFRGEPETAGMPTSVVECLEDFHVVRGEERRGGRWYELTHDRLIGAVTAVSQKWSSAAFLRQADQLKSFIRRTAVVGVIAAVLVASAFAWLAVERASKAEAALEAAQKESRARALASEATQAELLAEVESAELKAEIQLAEAQAALAAARAAGDDQTVEKAEEEVEAAQAVVAAGEAESERVETELRSAVLTWGGATWTLTTDPPGSVDWTTARDHCESLEVDGLASFRLPTIDELKSIVDEEAAEAFDIKIVDVFQAGVASNWIWSSEEDGSDSAFVYDYTELEPVSLDKGFDQGAQPLCVSRTKAISFVQAQRNPDTSWYAVSLSGFAPGASVAVTCHSTANPQGFYTLTLTVDENGSASEPRFCFSQNGQEHWVSGGGVETERQDW